MIAAASSQSSIWAYTPPLVYNRYLLPKVTDLLPAGTGPTQGNMGVWSNPSLAPNGLVYMLPINYGFTSTTVTNMIAVGVTGSKNEKTKWLFVSGNYTNRPDVPNGGNATTSTMRYGPRGILAPNGLIYFFPKQGISSILILDPKTIGLTPALGTATISGTTLTIASVSTGSFGIGQTITYTDPITSLSVNRTITNFVSGVGGIGTYTLDSAVPNPVVSATSITGSDFPTCTWEVTTWAAVAASIPGSDPTLFASQVLRGGILGQDGYIYIVPNGRMLLRMAPRNTSINNTTSDVYQIHTWYNGSNTTTRSFKSGNSTSVTKYWTPADINGTLLLKTAPYPTANIGGVGASDIHTGGLDSGILHPNGKIYLVGGSRWIFILDPSRWNLGDASVIYSENSLALQNSFFDARQTSIKNLILEKPKSEYIGKIREATDFVSGDTVTISLTDTGYVFDGMTISVYSGSGQFNNPTNIIVQSVDKQNRTFIARNTTGNDIINTNFLVNDELRFTPTTNMINSVGIFFTGSTFNTMNWTSNGMKVYRLDVSNNTILPFGVNNNTGSNVGSGESYININTILPNGLIYMAARETNTLTSWTGTGSDYPIITSASDIKTQQQPRSSGNNDFIKSVGSSPFYTASGAYSKIGGSVNAIGNSMGKIMFPSYTNDNLGALQNVAGGEFISIKGYTPFAKYFNYAISDKAVYEPPSDLTNLPISLYNCYFNKPY
jgi:hypothetical protein